MKKLFFILFILLPAIVHAKLQGQARIDSLLKELPKGKADTNKVILLSSLSFAYYSINPDEGIKYGNQAVALAERLGYKTGIARASNSIGVNFQYKSDYPTALQYYLEALNIYEHLNNISGITMVNNNIGIIYMQQCNYQKALEYYSKALKVYEETGNKAGIVNTITNIATVYNSQGNYPKALEFDFRALKMQEQIGDKTVTANITKSIGDIYSEQSDDPKALEYYFKVLKIDEETGNKNSMGNTFGSIGLLYQGQGDYPKAWEYFSKALKIDEEIGNTDMVAAVTANIGANHQLQGDYPQALSYFLKALKMDEETGNKSFIATVSGDIGDIYAIQKNYSEAVTYDQNALKIAKEIGEKHNIAFQLAHIGKFYLLLVNDTSKLSLKGPQITAEKKANLKRAIDYLEESIALSKDIHVSDVLIDDYKNVTEAYKLSGNYKAALESHEAWAALNDSVFSTDNKVKLANLATQREADLKEKQIEINEKHIAINKLAVTQKRNERIIFGAGSAMLLIVIIAVYRNYKSQIRTNKLQEESLQQKEMLMKEIHHRVKNTLALVGALMDLQLVNINDEKAREAVTESTTRLKAISWIHHQLYREDRVNTVECTRFISDLHTHVSAVFHKPGQNIVFRSEISKLVLDIDTAVPLGLILNELMTNSYKYAFNNDTDGSIACKVERAEEGYRMTYADSGPGLPAGLDIKTLKSLGMVMINGLSRQIGGSFTYAAATKTFVITFRDTDEMKKAA